MTQAERQVKLDLVAAERDAYIQAYLHKTQVRRFVQQTIRVTYARKMAEEAQWQQLQEISSAGV